MREKNQKLNKSPQANGFLVKTGLDNFVLKKKQKQNFKKTFWQFIILIALVGVLILTNLFINLNYKIKALSFLKNGKFLVLLQNNAEMRPAGGFIGSFAVIETRNYRPDSINFNSNIYKIDDTFTQSNTILPPEPLKNITNGKWAMRDANFAVDFAESAKQVQWFYTQETGGSVDGVIAINASLITDLLELTGPIGLPQYETTISADNFFDTLAFKIEKEYFFNQENWQEDEPKSILKDMMPLLIEKTLKLPKLKLVSLLNKKLEQKQILFFSNNEAYEKKIAKVNWGGLVKQTSGDYLYINNSNITDTSQNKNAGAKTSLKIQQSVNLNINNSDGLKTNTLAIKRYHTGSFKWPDGVNFNYMKVLVPEGSKLISANKDSEDMTKEVEIGLESGKTYFAIWTETSPLNETVVEFIYNLPPDISDDLTIQKQPGNLGDYYMISINNKKVFDGLINTDKDLF